MADLGGLAAALGPLAGAGRRRGFLTAQMISADMGPAIRSLMEPLGSLLEPVVAELLADGVRDLVLIPAGPAALLPWAAATVRGPEDSRPMPVGELLTLSVAPSAAAVVLGRERTAGRVRDAVAGRLLVVADPERQDARLCRVPGTRLAGSRRHSPPGSTCSPAQPHGRTRSWIGCRPAG